MTPDEIQIIQQNLNAKGFFCEVNGEWDAKTRDAWFSWASVNNVPRVNRINQPVNVEQTYGLLDSSAVASQVAADEEQRRKDAETAENERQRQIQVQGQIADEQRAAEAALNAEVARVAAEREAEREAERQAAESRAQQIAAEKELESEADTGAGAVTGTDTDGPVAKTAAGVPAAPGAPKGPKIVVNRHVPPTYIGGPTK